MSLNPGSLTFGVFFLMEQKISDRNYKKTFDISAIKLYLYGKMKSTRSYHFGGYIK